MWWWSFVFQTYLVVLAKTKTKSVNSSSTSAIAHLFEKFNASVLIHETDSGNLSSRFAIKLVINFSGALWLLLFFIATTLFSSSSCPSSCWFNQLSIFSLFYGSFLRYCGCWSHKGIAYRDTRSVSSSFHHNNNSHPLWYDDVEEVSQLE